MRKNLVATAIILLFVNIVSAQNIRLGFTGGLTYSNMLEKVGGENSHGKFKIGGTYGALVDAPMQKNGSFQIGVSFTQKGSKNETGSGSDLEKINTRLNYIEIPANVVFKFGKSNGKFLIGAGAAVALGVSGNSTLESGGTEVDKDINYGNKNDDDFKTVDFGANFLTGYEFNSGFFIALNYTHGINSLFVSGPDADKLLNQYFGLRIGYFIKGDDKGKK